MKKVTPFLLIILVLIINTAFNVYSNQNEFDLAKKAVSSLTLKLPADSVSDQQIKDSVNNLVFHDKDTGEKISLECISNLVSHLKDRPVVSSWLHGYAGRLNRGFHNEKKALDYFIASTNLLDSLYAEVTVQRQEALLDLGSSYYRLGDRENSDKAFLEAYSFPYWTFPRISFDVKRRIEIVYRRSITGLIMARAGNAQKLKEIRIIPAANDLMPKLEEAIKRAEGKLDQDE